MAILAILVAQILDPVRFVLMLLAYLLFLRGASKGWKYGGLLLASLASSFVALCILIQLQGGQAYDVPQRFMLGAVASLIDGFIIMGVARVFAKRPA